MENVLPFQGTVEYESLKSTLSNYIVEDRVLDSSEFGSPQRRKRLFVVAVAAHCIPKDGKIPWPEPVQSPPRPIGETVLEPISSLPEDVWLTEKGIAYMEQRKTWGARIFTRDQKGPMPTFCRSYSHQVHWKHCIKEHDGRLRKLTSREVARLQGFPDSWNCTIVSIGLKHSMCFGEFYRCTHACTTHAQPLPTTGHRKASVHNACELVKGGVTKQ